jgi:HEAT repeat protein
MSPGFSPSHVELLRDLRAAGHSLESIWDWVNHPVYSPDALPILLRHLEQTPDERLVEGIARALTDKRYRAAERPLVRAFARVENEYVRWAVGNAITTVGFRESEAEILAYCANPRFGTSRELLVGELYRIKRPEVEPLLISLLADERLDYFAASALQRIGGPVVLQALRALDVSSRSVRTRKKVPRVIAHLEARVAGA